MQANWVDFKTIKQSISIEQVLAHYQIKLRRSGKELRGRCPIHQGEGQDTFHASIEKNAFHCFSCQAKGNVLDFVAAMEHCTIREAGAKLQQWFALPTTTNEKPDYARETELATGSKPPNDEDRGEPNKPLGFMLKGIDHNHLYLTQRGIDQ